MGFKEKLYCAVGEVAFKYMVTVFTAKLIKNTIEAGIAVYDLYKDYHKDNSTEVKPEVQTVELS